MRVIVASTAWGASTTRCIHHRSGAWSHFSRMLVVPLGLASTALWSSSREIGAKKRPKDSKLVVHHLVPPGGPLDALADAELDLEFERLVHSASKW